MIALLMFFMWFLCCTTVNKLQQIWGAATDFADQEGGNGQARSTVTARLEGCSSSWQSHNQADYKNNEENEKQNFCYNRGGAGISLKLNRAATIATTRETTSQST
jgi:hypothetical protein